MSKEHIKTHSIENSTRIEIGDKTYENISSVNTQAETKTVQPQRKTSLDHTWEPHSQVDTDVRMCKALCKNEEVKFQNMDRMMTKQQHDVIQSQDYAMSKYQKRLERYKKAQS